MITEALDFRYLIIENYKKLKINEKELVTILVMDQLINEGNRFVTVDLLSLKMTLDTKEIDEIFAKLLTKGFIVYKTVGKKTVTSLDPLKERLYHDFQITLSNETDEAKREETENCLSNIYEQYEKLLNRPLSPVETSKIREWVSYGYEDKMIVDALKEALNHGKKSLRSVDNILLTWSTRDDRENEGVSPISEDWDKDLQETIRIAKTPWIDKDEDK